MQQIADKTEINDEGVLLATGYRLDQYEIESILAVGDFRITYYAWDHRGDRNVVIHEYYPRSLATRGEDKISVTSASKERFTDFEFGLSEFLLEARLVSQTRSAYLPNVIEYREANGTGYLVSEYDDGRTLRESLDRDAGQFTEKQLNEILNAALQGLRELHARNLLHTSVSPTNLFIRYHGHPILLGQGLARYRLAQYTKTYTISLAPGYTPLEQYGLDGNIGPWSDLYALGASLYECIAGIRPIDASTRHTSLIKGEQDPLTPAVELGQGKYSTLLLSNIDWMLKPYVEERPDSADLMLGVVSFQKQNKKNQKIAHTSTPLANEGEQVDSENKAANHLLDSPDIDTQITESVQPEYIEPKIRDNGRLVYWGLGLLLLAFIGIVGYQIYKYEISPTQLAQSPAADENAESVFNPIEISPSQTEKDDGGSTSSTSAAENRTITRESDEQRRDFYEGLYKEEEVQRRVEEELETLKLQQQAELAKQEQLQLEQINSLLDKADQANKKSFFLEPQGNNAFDYYSNVLQLQPGNDRAKAGINEIADIYFKHIIAAIEQKQPDKAGQHLKSLIKVRPDDPRLDGFLQQITDLKAKIKLDEAQLKLEQEVEAEKKAFFEQQKLANAKKENFQKSEDATVTAQPAAANDEPVNTEKALPEQTEKTEQTTAVAQQPTKAPEAPIESESTDPADADKKVEQPEPAINKSQLAKAYQNYDRGDYSTQLFNTMLNAAEVDEGRAQYILAEMYAAGRGVEQNFAESTFWLKRSLDYVNQNAKYRQAWAEKAMGVIYEKGWYVDSNPERAVRWYRSSADKGYAPAQYRLGLAYAKGLGVNKDFDQAENWLKKALSNGNQEAKKALTKISARN